MSVLEVILIALSTLVVLAILAERLRIPYPVLLVLGGIVLGLVPGLPSMTFQPNLIFLLFVPPLLLSTAWRASWHEWRANLRPIASLAIGLVIATIAAVAAVAHWLIPDMAWPVAFVLGTIVSATDPAAVTAIAQRLNVPRQIVSILEGESLGNDATSLVAYRVAVAAVVAGTFSMRSAISEFIFAAIAGVALGLATGYLYVWLQRRLDHPSVEVTITLLLPFIAYIPANRLGASGVLAVVTAGIYAGWHEPEIRSADTRLQATAVWDTIVFVLNGLIFILLGLQLRTVFEGVASRPPLPLAGDVAVVLATVTLVRILWTLGFTSLLALLRRAAPFPVKTVPSNSVPVIAWAGMRGADTLVLALALPLMTGAGAPFPARSMLIFLAFSVIVLTLVGQGLTMPRVIRRAGLRKDNVEAEVSGARAAAHSAAVRHIDELSSNRTLPDTAADVRARHERLAQYHTARSAGEVDQEVTKRAESLQQLRQDLVDVQRRTIVEMHGRGEISTAAMRAVLRELDLEEQRRKHQAGEEDA